MVFLILGQKFEYTYDEVTVFLVTS